MQEQNEKVDVYQIVTDRIIELLEKGVVPWRKPWATDERLPMNLVSGKPYSGINVFLLHVAGFSSPYWVTMKQANERGGHIKAGEKSTIVTFWKSYMKDATTGKPIKGRPAEGQDVKSIRVLRYYRVWNVEQTIGVDYPKPEARSVEFNPIAEADAIIAAMPNKPTMTSGGSRAYYRPSTDTVNLPDRSSFPVVEEYYSTAFHELAHSTGAKSRLDRFAKDESEQFTFGNSEYSKEELVAEMTAAFLCGVSGIVQKTIDNSAAYIAAWLQRLKDDRKLVVSAAGQAHKAADYIQGRIQPVA